MEIENVSERVVPALDLERARFFSDSNFELIKFLSESTEAKSEKVDLYSASVNHLMHGYKYPMTPWPVIISQSMVREFEHIIEELPRLYTKALRLYFKKDSAHFSDYFRIPEHFYELFNKIDIKPEEMFIRHDLLFSNNTIKMVETNVGSTLGGWQYDWYESEFDSFLNKYPKTRQLQIYKRNIFKEIFLSLIDMVIRIKPGRKTVNVLIPSMSPMDEKDMAYIIPSLSAAEGEGSTVEIKGYIIHSFDDLVFAPNGCVYYNNIEMDVMLTTIKDDIRTPDVVSAQIYNSCAKNKFVFFDGIVSSVMGNKVMYSLLHEPELLAELAPEEVEIIQKHIPFTTRLIEGDMLWKGEYVNRKEFVAKYKDKLVLKKTLSHEGRDVFIGKQTSQFEWNLLIESCLRSRMWIAQEFCGSDVYPACTLDGEIENFHFIWGIFDLGGSYKGAFVRGVEVEQKQGVINAATGAKIFVVYEERNKRRIRI